jgi:hypothetical protein
MLWPAEDPLGHVVSVGEGRGGGRYEIVGIARDFAFGSLSRPATGVVVVTAHEHGFGIEPQFVIRATWSRT